jgi:hypothetical protein
VRIQFRTSCGRRSTASTASVASCEARSNVRQKGVD